MARKGFLGDFGRYFDNETYSDVTIVSGSEKIRAHRVVLSQASTYFVSCFEREFKEKSQPVLELKEDDPKAIRGLIAYAYGLHYDGQDDYSSWRVTLSPTRKATTNVLTYAKYQVDLYIAATKYMVRNLAMEIEMHFAGMARNLINDGKPSQDLIDIAGYVYIEHDSTASSLRPMIVRVLKQFMGVVKGSEGFKAPIADAPELSVHLLTACDEEIEQLKTNSRKRAFGETDSTGGFSYLPTRRNERPLAPMPRQTSQSRSTTIAKDFLNNLSSMRREAERANDALFEGSEDAFDMSE